MDILDEMTKDEIISWVRKQFFYSRDLPRKSELLWIRYEKKERALSDRRKLHIERGKSLNLAKRDEYARRFNATHNLDKRRVLLDKMEPYEKKYQAYLLESKAITDAGENVEKLYAKIEIERKKEAIKLELTAKNRRNSA